MTRVAVLLAAATPALVAALPAQDIDPRGADYAFITTVDDARAAWINPAGLAAFTEASIMGELAVERQRDESFEVGQWTLGFNSRGFALSYQRDEHLILSPASVLRASTAFGFTGGAVGAAFSTYSSDDNTERGLDLGVRLDPSPALTVAAVVRHIGRPVVRMTRLPISGIAGVSWTPLPARVQLAGEIIAIESPAPADSYDVTYRAGARLSMPGRFPIGVITAFDLGSNVRIDGWTVGLAVGGDSQLVATGSVVPLEGGVEHLHTVSLTGVASRRPSGRQF